MILNRQQIMEIIPHRAPFLLLDDVLELEPGKRCVAEKHVVKEDFWVPGHFPEHAVMPGVLIVEALAQTGAVAILSKPENQGKIAYFGGIEKCRFKRKVRPGDKIRLETRIIREKGPLGIGEAIATVDGEIAVKAELTFMVG